MKLNKIKLIDFPRGEYSLSQEEMGKLVGALYCHSYFSGANGGSCISYDETAPCNGSNGTLCDLYSYEYAD